MRYTSVTVHLGVYARRLQSIGVSKTGVTENINTRGLYHYKLLANTATR